MIGTNIPDFVYINEPRVQQRTQFLNSGQVNEIVETYSESNEKKNTWGFDVPKIFTALRESTSGSAEEISKNIQSTPVGQLAVFFGMMDMDMGVHELDSLSEDQVDEVEDGHFVVLSGNIREAPITKFMRMKQHYNLSLQDMGLSLEDEDVSEEVIRTELEDASDIYQMSLGDSVDGKSVFRLPTDNMTGIEPRFPKEYKEYTVFGSVEHRYERGERQYHLSVFNEMNTKSRAEKNKRRRQLKRMASSASDFYEESIDDSIFYIEAPDIEINPIAVYF